MKLAHITLFRNVESSHHFLRLYFKTLLFPLQTDHFLGLGISYFPTLIEGFYYTMFKSINSNNGSSRKEIQVWSVWNVLQPHEHLKRYLNGHEMWKYNTFLFDCWGNERNAVVVVIFAAL